MIKTWDIEKVIADELAFAEYLKTLYDWLLGLIVTYNDVDIACQHAMDEASKEDRERIRRAWIAVRDAERELNRRATLTWGTHEGIVRQQQLVDLTAQIMKSVTPA